MNVVHCRREADDSSILDPNAQVVPGIDHEFCHQDVVNPIIENAAATSLKICSSPARRILTSIAMTRAARPIAPVKEISGLRTLDIQAQGSPSCSRRATVRWGMQEQAAFAPKKS